MLSEEQLENYRNHGRGDFGNLSIPRFFVSFYASVNEICGD